MNLYTISDRYEQALIEFEDTELPDEVIADTLEALEGELIDKGKNVAAFIKNMEADVKAIKEAAKAMRDRASVMERRANYLKLLLLNTMQKHKINEISCPWFVIKPRRNPPAVTITNADNISKKYLKEVIEYKIDKKMIAADLRLGAVVHGAEFTQRWRLDIK
jgi:hypothetical protein